MAVRTSQMFIALAAAVAVASCASDATDGTAPPAESVQFVSVVEGESWSDVVKRVADCSSGAAEAAAVGVLQSANPVLADVGLAGDQIIAVDPARLDAIGCGTVQPGDTVQPGRVAQTEAPALPPTPTPTPSPTPTPDPETAGAATPSEPPVPPVQGGPAVQGPAPAIDRTAHVVAFEEDFALAESLDRFRWQIHHSPAFQGTPETWQGDHDESCGPPSTTRTITMPPEGTDHGDAAYWCAPAGPGSEHMMTSFRTTGYAQVAFSPDEVFVDVARVCWNQNMTDLGRKWTQMLVVPEDVFQANDERLDYVKPSIEFGPGASGVFLSADEFLYVMQDGSTVTHVGRTGYGEDFRGFTTEDKRRRYRTCLTDLDNGNVRIELEREDSIEVRELPGAFPAGPARVIFQDDTYNSTKRPTPVPEPFTWHWDDLLVETRP